MEFSRLSQKDCGKEMTREEGRQVQLDMMDALANFCDENDLRYYLSGGTLLGAIRHKGFIPWDDDIDVNMPRPDCERLMQLTDGSLDKYIVMGPDMNEFAMCCGFYRIYDFNTVIENFFGGATQKYPTYHPIFIDVFPIEGLPDKTRQIKFQYLKIVTLRKMQRSSALEHMIAKSITAHIFHIVSRIPAKLVGYKRWSQAIQKTAQKYNFDTQKYVGVMTAPVHTTEEKVIKEDYIQATDVMFEGKLYHAPGNYDTYLTQLYGNYMQMPSEEKQQSHHEFHMYWRNSESV